MKGSIELSPLGTAREGIGVSEQPVGEVELLRWLGHIREQLKTLYNLDEEVAFLAWELSRWQPGLEAGDRQALILLILTALIQEGQGSTRIAFRSSEGRRSATNWLEVCSDPMDPTQQAVEPDRDHDRLGPDRHDHRHGGRVQALGRRRRVPLPSKDVAPGKPICRSPAGRTNRRRHPGLVS